MKMYTISEIMDIFDIGYDGVYKHIRTGELQAKKIRRTGVN